MSKILITYATDWKNTEKMAHAVEKGAGSVVGTEVVLKPVDQVTADDLLQADGVIIGTPVHMGSMDARVKAFIDKVCSGLWMKDAMNGKVGAVFATGAGFGNAGGGVELTMLSVLNNLAELGMVLVPLPKNTPGYAKGGLQWGPYGRSMGENMEQTGLPDACTVAAEHHGANVARLAGLLKGRKVFGV